MIVYRAQTRVVNAAARLAELRRAARELRATARPEHDAIRNLVADFGVLEAAVVDTLSPDRDALTPVVEQWRTTSEAIAALFVASWEGAATRELREHASAAGAALDALAGVPAPTAVSEGVPEGFAYYGLSPEQYAVAARRLAQQRIGRDALCIGVRGIGAALSSVATAALRRVGWRVRSFTVRPRGHPFARELALAPSLERALRALSHSLVVVADEGPGLSGSSFASVSRALAALGVPDERIVLMPSFVPDGSAFISDAARDRWRRHEKIVASFDEVWLESGRLCRDASLGAQPLADRSAGAWREVAYESASRWPAVHPQHERRKFGAVMGDGTRVRLEFAGYGRAGREAIARATRLAHSGITLAPRSLAAGFLVVPELECAPLDGATASAETIDAVAAYLAHLDRSCHTGDGANAAALAELVAINAREALGEDVGPAVARWHRAAGAIDAPAVALDARIFPHEWLRTRDGLVKTDAVVHHDDHFYPGPQDIAWDLAATCVELSLDAAARRALGERFIAHGGDRDAPRRTPIVEVAYLAFRVGYATLARDTLGQSDDGWRWRREVPRYAHRLRRVLERLADAA